MVTDEYRAYLLRLWCVEDNGKRWRARLENVETKEVQGFASLDGLIEFLHTLDAEARSEKDASGEMNTN